MKRFGLIAAILTAALLMPHVSAEELSPAETAPFPETAASFAIDNAHIYGHMQQSYAAGYEPEILGDYAVIVLPLICTEGDAPDALRVSVGLEASGSPFVVKNYEQTVPLAEHPASDGASYPCYLAEFWLAMYTDRVNGCYPVTLQTQEAGAYTVYVNIRDGKDPNAAEPEPPAETQPPEEPPVLMPKLLVSSVTGQQVTAGETAALHISLRNTSQTEPLQNLTVTASAPAYFRLRGDSDTLFFAQTGADAEFGAAFAYDVAADTPAGQYDIPLSFDYAYGKGMTGSGTAHVSVTVSQPLSMEFSQVAVPAEAVVSDRLELHVQAMNLSRTDAKNVRAVLKCDGLLPEGAAFIGDVAGGASAETVMAVQVSSKAGAEPYGTSEGEITFFYADQSGQEFTETQTFSITLKSPFSERRTEPEQAKPQTWLWMMAALGGMILLTAGYLLFRSIRRHA